MTRIFILSPAHCAGKRARLICNGAATSDLAARLRSPAGAPLGEVFSFVSGLYFRGKLRYAQAFAQPPESAAGVFVVTPAEGLRGADDAITVRHLERYASVPIAPDELRYRHPLVRDAQRLGMRIGGDCEVVLLGSVATAKYLEVLTPIFGERLRVPRDFVGRGDMSRGALLLRCVAEGRELDYAAPPSWGRTRPEAEQI